MSPISKHPKSMDITWKKLRGSPFSDLFSIPTTTESTCIRVIQNFFLFGSTYAALLWSVLFIGLVQSPLFSLGYVITMTGVLYLYYKVLHEMCKTAVFHKETDKRSLLLVVSVMAFLLLFVTVYELVLLNAGIVLVVTIFLNLSAVMVHAIWCKAGDSVVVHEGPNDSIDFIFFFLEKQKAVDSQPDDLV